MKDNAGGLDPAADFQEDPPPATTTDGKGNNSQTARAAAWKRILPAAYELDEKIEAILQAQVTPLRDERNKLFAELRDDFDVPTRVRVAEYARYRIERDAIDKGDDLTRASLHEAHRALNEGETADMIEVLKRADAKREQLAKEKQAKAARAAARTAKAGGKVTEGAEQAL